MNAMSLYSTSGARPAAVPVLPAVNPASGRTPVQQAAPASGNVAAGVRPVEAAQFRDDMVSLSKLGVQARGVNGMSTSDSALNLMTTFAERLFGAVSVPSVAYNLQSFRASPTAAPEAASPDDIPAAPTFDPRQSTSFTGVGELATDDGRNFEFELSVKYQASNDTGAAPLPVEKPDALLLTGTPLPAIKFPGSLDDLFKLLSRELRSNVADSESFEVQGALTIRLLRLVDQAALLAPRLRADDPELAPAERAKLVASTYSSGNV